MLLLTVRLPNDREPSPQLHPGVSGSSARRVLGGYPIPGAPSLTTRYVIGFRTTAAGHKSGEIDDSSVPPSSRSERKAHHGVLEERSNG